MSPLRNAAAIRRGVLVLGASVARHAALHPYVELRSAVGKTLVNYALTMRLPTRRPFDFHQWAKTGAFSGIRCARGEGDAWSTPRA
jgi:hypothetical protein